MTEVSSSFLDRIRHEYLCSDRFIEQCDHVFWADSFGTRPPDCNFEGGDSIFCKIDRVWECFGRLVRTNRRVVLVTGQGDFPINEQRLGEAPAHIHAWFGSNALAIDSRIHPLPLGLGSPTCRITMRASDIADALSLQQPRTKWLYVNFRPDTNPIVRQPVYAQFDCLRHEDWVTFQPPAERGADTGYLDALMTHRFVLCPPGFGIDTHRMWETLYARAIPIVLRSSALRAFEHLPVLFVDDFAEVTFERLRTEEERITSTSWNLDALFLPYWHTKLEAAKAELRHRPNLTLPEWSGAFRRAFVRRFLK